MLLPPFTLHRPTSLTEALELLSTLEDSMVYMGGTELLLLMKMGLAQPEHLVDCKHLPGLGEIQIDGDAVRIGGSVTHRSLERDPKLARALPKFSALISHVANVRVRNAGTLAGNLCFAEPHSDPASMLLVLGAQVRLVSLAGRRELAIDEFIQGPLQTVLDEGEIMTEIIIPLPPADARISYERFAVKERPMINVAAIRDGTGVRIVLGAVGPRPMRLTAVEHAVQEGEPGGRATTLALALAREAVVLRDDNDGSAEYKTHLVGVLLNRALESIGAS